MTVQCIFCIHLRFPLRNPTQPCLTQTAYPAYARKRSIQLGTLLRGDDIQQLPMQISGSGESPRQQHRK